MSFRFISAFSLLFAVYSANCTAIKNSTAVKTHAGTDGETVVCNQYIGLDPSANEAIKKLDEKLSKKLDELIKLISGKPPINPG